MAQPFQFDEAVLKVVADDKEMVATLKRSEQATTHSAQQMQTALDGVSVSVHHGGEAAIHTSTTFANLGASALRTGSSATTATTGLSSMANATHHAGEAAIRATTNVDQLGLSAQSAGQAAGAAMGGVSVLGAAAAVTGNQSLMLSAQMGTLAAAMTTTANSALAVKVQLMAATHAAVAFIATPLGAALTVIGTVLAVVTLSWHKNRMETKKVNEELKELNDTLEAAETSTRKFADATERLADKLAVVQGRMSQAEATARVLRATLGEQLAGGVALQEVERRYQIETQLVDLAKTRAHAKRKERMDEERSARIAKIRLDLETERTRVSEAASAAAKAEAQALSSIAGPQTRMEARTMIDRQLKLADAQQRAIYMLTKELEANRPGGERHTVISQLLSRLGVQATGAPARPTMRFGQGAIELSAFAATGRGGAGTAGPDPIQSTRIAKENKRTKDIDEIRKSSERTAVAIEKWRPGAG